MHNYCRTGCRLQRGDAARQERITIGGEDGQVGQVGLAGQVEGAQCGGEIGVTEEPTW